jgi:putative cardiolipin synthase
MKRPRGFAAVELAIRNAHGAEASGFYLLDNNEDGLCWRLTLLDQARHSLDLRYFLWYGDDSGILLMKRVVQAADRGVHVRPIVDDLLTIGRDFRTATLDAHRNHEFPLLGPVDECTVLTYMALYDQLIWESLMAICLLWTDAA